MICFVPGMVFKSFLLFVFLSVSLIVMQFCFTKVIALLFGKYSLLLFDVFLMLRVSFDLIFFKVF